MRALILAGVAVLSGCSALLGGSDLDDLHPGTAPPDTLEDSGSPGIDGQVINHRDSGRADDGSPLPPPPPPPDGGPLPDGGPRSDGGVDAPVDSAPSDCGSLGPGDLVIVEIMIASQIGSGDRGEWLEVRSTRACNLDLRGLRVESPRGTTSDYLDITTTTLLPPGGSFVVADSADPLINHGLGARVYEFAGSASDVLKNSGDTITVSLGGVTIDTLTYDATLPWLTGASMAFPAACPASSRTSWASWGWSSQEYGGLFLGTPNGANTDIACH